MSSADELREKLSSELTAEFVEVKGNKKFHVPVYFEY